MSEDVKQLYLEYRALTEQAKRVQEFLEQTAENVAEVGNTIRAVEEVAKLKKGDRLFAPVANGIFVDARLDDPGTLRMNVGGKVVSAKSTQEVVALLEKQREELRTMRDRATAEYEEMVQRIREIESRVEAAEKE